MNEAGGTPFERSDDDVQPIGRTAAYRIGRGMLGTVPIVLASSMAISMNLSGSLFAHDAVQPDHKKPGVSPDVDANGTSSNGTNTINAVGHSADTRFDLSSQSLGSPQRVAPHLTASVTTGDSTTGTSDGVIEAARTAPTSYRVVAGDTVSSIAGRFGLSTASVLALNGLSWKSTIYPGQTLSLSSAKATKPTPTDHSAAAHSAAAHTPTKAATTAAKGTAKASTYTIVRGDTLSSIAARHGVPTTTLLAANGLGWSSIIYPGQKIAIPGSGSATASPTTHSAGTASTTTSGAKTTTSTTSTKDRVYVIKSGDTLSSIAKAHATTVEKLLAANHLSWTSLIYAGKKLTIPATVVASTVTTAATGVATSIVSDALTEQQKANARLIIRVGRTLGVSDQGIVIALAAAAQESSLTNLASGDRDSVGLFQQRPSQGWGTRAQLVDPVYATKLFFGGSRNPNAGKTRGLLDVRGWTKMTLTQAAQAVQFSAYPDAYAKWERPARSWLASL